MARSVVAVYCYRIEQKCDKEEAECEAQAPDFAKDDKGGNGHRGEIASSSWKRVSTVSGHLHDALAFDAIEEGSSR
jgi:hypothetical protein